MNGHVLGTAATNSPTTIISLTSFTYETVIA